MMNERAAKLNLIYGEHTLIVGVDIAKKKHWARIMDTQTKLEIGSPFSFQNNISGFTSLLGRIAQAHPYCTSSNVLQK